MSLNEENKARIDKYIEAHTDSKTGEHFPISLKGRRQMLDIYRLPTDMLFYNIKNGRFAAEYGEQVRREGGHLDPEKKGDEEEIKKLLLDINKGETKKTYDDLLVRGQWNCCIITVDGYLIDGNRRKAIISKLHSDTGQESWRYIEAARLDRSITPMDLWALEAGIQLGKDEIVRYGPINEMLKIREGKLAGLSEKEIVNALYGYDNEEEIREKLDRLDLIERYLEFVGRPKQYSLVKQKVEHFINLQNIIKNCRVRNYDPDKTVKIRRATFQLIREDVPHLDIRKINQMIDRDLNDAVSEIEEAGENLTPAVPTESDNVPRIDKEVSAAIDEFDSNEELSPTVTKFVNATDILDVNKAEGEGIRLLRRAEANLKALLDYRGDELSDPEASNLINKLDSHIRHIAKMSGNAKHGS